MKTVYRSDHGVTFRLDSDGRTVKTYQSGRSVTLPRKKRWRELTEAQRDRRRASVRRYQSHVGEEWFCDSKSGLRWRTRNGKLYIFRPKSDAQRRKAVEVKSSFYDELDENEDDVEE